MLFTKNKKVDKREFQKISYSQCGEDLIIDFIFYQLQIEKPTYLDIGAHHPYYLSNTAYFYNKGCMGVSVEPDPQLFEVIKKERPNENCLNIGVGKSSGGTASFYIMSASTLNTFSKAEADRYASYGDKSIKEVIQLPLLSVNDIIVQHFNNNAPNFVSLDVEGMDLEIIQSFDFLKYKPNVFCIETLTYTEDKTEQKLTDIINYVESKGYFLYADTFINSIFVEKETWKNR
jgi:FkbM family methyltransferase